MSAILQLRVVLHLNLPRVYLLVLNFSTLDYDKKGAKVIQGISGVRLITLKNEKKCFMASVLW